MPPDAVLVTGGAGFIGSALCRALVARGHRVVAYDNLHLGRAAYLPSDPHCELVQGDVRDADALRRTMRALSPPAVVHLAALHFIPYCNAHPEETHDVNVKGTRAVLEACREWPPRRVVFASSAAVYPVGGGPFSEEHAPAPVDVYGTSKLAGEELVRAFAEEAGVASVIARLFNAFGPRDTNPHLVPDLLAQIGQGGAIHLGNLDPVRDYVHVEDVASALVALLDVPVERNAVFNVGSGEGRSVRDVVAAFEAAVGRPLAVQADPSRMRKVERAELVAVNGKLRGATGWRPRIGFAEGIRALVYGSEPGVAVGRGQEN